MSICVCVCTGAVRMLQLLFYVKNKQANFEYAKVIKYAAILLENATATCNVLPLSPLHLPYARAISAVNGLTVYRAFMHQFAHRVHIWLKVVVAVNTLTHLYWFDVSNNSNK